jgi:hypothetical protein
LGFEQVELMMMFGVDLIELEDSITCWPCLLSFLNRIVAFVVGVVAELVVAVVAVDDCILVHERVGFVV